MNKNKSIQPTSKKNEIAIALIGLLGILATALFSNWDKILPKEGVVTAPYSGYRPTGKFETELRYLVEVTGMRAQVERLKEQLSQSFKMSAIAHDPEHAAEIEKSASIASELDVSMEDVIKLFLPIYQKYFSLQEIQELNKFYSTEAMQAMVSRNSSYDARGCTNNGGINECSDETFPGTFATRERTFKR